MKNDEQNTTDKSLALEQTKSIALKNYSLALEQNKAIGLKDYSLIELIFFFYVIVPVMLIIFLCLAYIGYQILKAIFFFGYIFYRILKCIFFIVMSTIKKIRAIILNSKSEKNKTKLEAEKFSFRGGSELNKLEGKMNENLDLLETFLKNKVLLIFKLNIIIIRLKTLRTRYIYFYLCLFTYLQEFLYNLKLKLLLMFLLFTVNSFNFNIVGSKLELQQEMLKAKEIKEERIFLNLKRNILENLAEVNTTLVKVGDDTILLSDKDKREVPTLKEIELELQNSDELSPKSTEEAIEKAKQKRKQEILKRIKKDIETTINF